MRRDPNRERLRARQACRNCRKKKARCPSERPACSSCVRLNHSCVYDEPRPSDRLTNLEKKVDIILSGRGQQYVSDHIDEDPAGRKSLQPSEASTRLQPDDNTDTSPSRAPFRYPNSSMQLSSPSRPEFSAPKLDVPEATIVHGIDVYFERFHRQPIWCFDRQHLGHYTEVSTELIYSILELTARLSQEDDPPRYGESARWAIMLRVANDTVELETIESLCLLSYSSFIDGDIHRGQFYLGLGIQLCRAAKLGNSSTTLNGNPATEREKRLLWSLQSLEQFYGQQSGLLRTAPEVWRPYYLSDSADTEFPQDLAGASTGSDPGIWTISVHFGWIWSRVREYVADCSRNKLTEPWRLDSTYAKLVTDMTEIENKAPLCHRYDIVKFHERGPEEVQRNKDYWMPWLKLQFVWHSILTMINHPFLYIVTSPHHPRLSIPNTFWRKSSEQVLLHATWIVRTIDMIYEKEIQLLDPFFGHGAAIAATVHLYFYCAVDPRLRQKSKADLAKCQKFLKSFSAFSPACESLGRSVDKMIRIALEPENENVDYEWTPSRIQLSIPLMWAVLQFDLSSSEVVSSPSGDPATQASPAQSEAVEEMERNSTLEISVTATPPAVIIDPALGHDARLPPYKASSTSTSTSPNFPNSDATRDIVVPPAESLMFNTPWLWADLPEFANLEDGGQYHPDLTNGNSSEGFSTWWNFGSL